MGVTWRKASAICYVQAKIDSYYRQETLERGAIDRRNRYNYFKNFRNQLMANIIYKTLFSVQLLHEYYLINNDGSSLFDGNTNESDFLLDRLNNDITSISANFLYDAPTALKTIFENYHLYILPHYAGFAVM